MRVMTLCEFFFPSTKSSRTSRDSRPHTRVTISPSHRASIHITPTPEHSLPGSYPNTQHSPNASDEGHKAGAEASETDHLPPPIPHTGRQRRPSRRSHLQHSSSRRSRRSMTGAAGSRHQRQRHGGPVIQPAGEISQNQEHPDHPLGNQDAPRFSHYREAVLQTGTCFVGPATGPEAVDAEQNFPDRSIRFRVLEQSDEDGVDGEREMVVVSSPGNIPWVVETLAPPGAGRRVFILARNPEGEVLRGELELLARILPLGWPFDIVVESE